jgi:hypothetical protein
MIALALLEKSPHQFVSELVRRSGQPEKERVLVAQQAKRVTVVICPGHWSTRWLWDWAGGRYERPAGPLVLLLPPAQIHNLGAAARLGAASPPFKIWAALNPGGFFLAFALALGFDG